MKELFRAMKLNCMIVKNEIYSLFILSLIAGITWRMGLFGPIILLISFFVAAILSNNLSGKIRRIDYLMYDLMPVDYSKRIISMYIITTAAMLISFFILTSAVMLVFGFGKGDDISALFTGFGENGLDILSFGKRTALILAISVILTVSSLYGSAELNKRAYKKKYGQVYNLSGIIYFLFIMFRTVFSVDLYLPVIIFLITIAALTLFCAIKSYHVITKCDSYYGEKNDKLYKE